MLFQHGELNVRLQREAPSAGIMVHQTLRKGNAAPSLKELYYRTVGTRVRQPSDKTCAGLDWGQA